MNERYRLEAGAIPEGLLDKPLLFDTNVWFFIHGPFIDPKDLRHRIYSNLYAAALRAGTSVLLPQVVLTEFVGKCLRFHKDVAGSAARKVHLAPEYKDWISDIADDVYHIAQACRQVDDGFGETDTDECFAAASSGGIDFNDLLIARLCEKRGFVLVTDDSDYAGQNLPIASSNPKLFGG